MDLAFYILLMFAEYCLFHCLSRIVDICFFCYDWYYFWRNRFIWLVQQFTYRRSWYSVLPDLDVTVDHHIKIRKN